MSEPPAGTALREQLTRWTEAGLIDPEQASRIVAAEARQPSQSADSQRRRLPLVVEALGYLGAVIAIAAGATVVQHFWRSFPPSAQTTFAGVVAVVLLIVGAVLRIGGDPALGRLRSVLWLISTVSAAVFVGALTGQFGHLSGATVALLSEGAGTLYAIVLWWRTRSTLQHLAVFAGAEALVVTAIYQVTDATPGLATGLGIWVLSALWGIAVHRGYLVPRTAGIVASGIGLLLGAQLAMIDATAGQVLAFGTVALLLALGVASHRVLLLGFGAVGAIVLLPQIARQYLPNSAAAALSVCAVGLILLGIALWLARTRKTA